jgi:folate-binding protein YgfZ
VQKTVETSSSLSSAFDTPPEQVLQLSGADARLVLQGQTTADFQKAEVGTQLHAAFCNPKGRVLADTLAVVVAEDTVLMRGRQSVMTKLAAHLKPYIAFSKSTLMTLDLAVCCYRNKAAQNLDPNHVLIDRHNGVLSVIAVGRGMGFTEHWHSSDATIVADPKDEVSIARVDFETARARIESNTIAAFLPQDLNYDLNETVSFTKGCYTGQEIVARLHYRGTPKRRLFRATLSETAEPPAPGESIRNSEGQHVGSLVNLSPLDGEIGALLEVMPDATTTPLFVGDKQLTLSSLAPCHPVADQSTG